MNQPQQQQQKQRKISHKKQKNQPQQPPSNAIPQAPRPSLQSQAQQQRVKQKKQPLSQKNNKGVNFNLKKNFVEKFYCPEMAIANLTKSDPIDLGSIQDLPEIPLDSLFGTR